MTGRIFPSMFLKTNYSHLLQFPRTRHQYHQRNKQLHHNHHHFHNPQPILITLRKLFTVAAARKNRNSSKLRNSKHPLQPSPPLLPPHLNTFTHHPLFASHLHLPSNPLTSKRSRFSRHNHPQKHTHPLQHHHSIFHKSHTPREESLLLGTTSKRLPPLHLYYHYNPPHLNLLLLFLLFLPP